MTSRASREYRYEKLTWPEINDAVKRKKVVVVPIGSIEQHGPHLPLDVDMLEVTAVAGQRVDLTGGVAVQALPGGLVAGVPPVGNVPGLGRAAVAGRRHDPSAGGCGAGRRSPGGRRRPRTRPGRW